MTDNDRLFSGKVAVVTGASAGSYGNQVLAFDRGSGTGSSMESATREGHSGKTAVSETRRVER